MKNMSSLSRFRGSHLLGTANGWVVSCRCPLPLRVNRLLHGKQIRNLQQDMLQVGRLREEKGRYINAEHVHQSMFGAARITRHAELVLSRSVNAKCRTLLHRCMPPELRCLSIPVLTPSRFVRRVVRFVLQCKLISTSALPSGCPSSWPLCNPPSSSEYFLKLML